MIFLDVFLGLCFTDSTMLNHLFSPFGRTFLDIFRGIFETDPSSFFGGLLVCWTNVLCRVAGSL